MQRSARTMSTAVWMAICMGSALLAGESGPIPRAAWTNRRLTGTPEPPPPYTVERTFSSIAWQAPLYIAPVPGSDNLIVVLQGGDAGRPSRVVLVADDPNVDKVETVLELDGRLIYAAAFHPRFESNRFLFVFSNGPGGDNKRRNRISRFTVSREAPFKAEPESQQTILEWRSEGHDGGDLAFGPDGMLYITSGDGTGDSDTWNSGQDLDNLLAALLRIDVDRAEGNRPYAIPPDNPFVNLPGARGEIWAYGFRNPWRMCIDRSSGDIWVGNNGQDQWETAYLVRRGDNFGWSVYEGSHSFYPERKRGPTPIVRPTIEHPHSQFRSLTGGVVYRGERRKELDGCYIYGDYATGKIWGARHDAGMLTEWRELADTTLQIVAFGVDRRGEILIVDHGGGIYRLVPDRHDANEPPFPTRLSDTGLFDSTARHQVAVGLIPYSVNAPGWMDGAAVERFLALPDGAKIGYASSRGWNFENGTVVVQTLSLPWEPGGTKRIETRLLVRRQSEWTGYSYRWSDDQVDAELVEPDGVQIALPTADRDAGAATWRFPSRAECLACHSRAANYLLGLTEPQMNRDHNYGGVVMNQLAAFAQAGLFSAPPPKPPAELSRLANPYDSSQPLDPRARSYLHANCSGCHVAAGGGNAQMELEIGTAVEAMRLIGARPQHETFGISDAMLVAPGNPEHSVLLHRLSRRGRGQMPPLVVNRADEQGIALFRQWIAEMKPARPFVRNWQMAELLPFVERGLAARSDAAGKGAFRDTGCIQCHRLGAEGGTVGPDLTGIGRRQNAAQVLESILLPSKVLAEGYASSVVETESGEVVTGRIEREDAETIVIRGGTLATETITVAKSQIRSRALSDKSNMPEGIVNVLNAEEIADLIAYLMSGEEGNRDHSDRNAEGGSE